MKRFALIALTIIALAGVVAWAVTWAVRHQPLSASASAVLEGTDIVDHLADGEVVIDAGAVLAMLDDLEQAQPELQLEYDRDQFGPRWSDVDRNGCDTRNDVLARDLTAPLFKPGTHDCVVTAGTLEDAYTSSSIPFTRGDGTSQLVPIDHIWPLNLAWQHGAATWTTDKRTAFANDQLGLQAVSLQSNSSKSDQGPGNWMPRNDDFRCEYIARFILIASRYELTISPDDAHEAADTLRRCA